MPTAYPAGSAIPVLLQPLPPPAPAEQVVVTGRAPERSPGARAYAETVLDRETLQDAPSGRLDQALRLVPGFQLFRRSDARSSNPTAGGPTLRGLGGNAASRALVLLDGVPVADPFGGWVPWPALDPERLASATVIRGGTGAGGPGALAGTILLESVGPDETARLSADAAIGSRDGLELGAVAAGAIGPAWASLSGRVQAGDGFAPVVRRDRGPVDRTAPFRQGSAAARLLLPVGSGAELQLSGLLFEDRRTRGLPNSDIRVSGADASARLVGRHVTATVWRQERSFSTLFASADDTRATSRVVLDQFAVPATGLGGSLEVRRALGRIDIRVGTDARRQEGETRERFAFEGGSATRGRTAGGESAVAGAWAEAGWRPREDVLLTGGARIDRWWIVDGRQREAALATGAPTRDERFPDRAGWRPTARGGLAWAVAPGATLRAAAYTGWRLPTLNELYRPFRVGADAVAANPALRPERLRGVELGADLRPAAGLRLSFTLFGNRLGDAIANVTLSRGPGLFPQVGFVSAAGEFAQRLNLRAIRSRGLELDGAWERGAWDLAGGVAFADARVRAGGAAAPLDGLRPAQAPRWTGSLRAGWRPTARVRASATLRYQGGQWEDDLNRLRLRPALTLDASARWALRPSLALEARGENLFDEEVQAGRTADGVVERATPRTLWLGVAWRFGDPT